MSAHKFFNSLKIFLCAFIIQLSITFSASAQWTQVQGVTDFYWYLSIDKFSPNEIIITGVGTVVKIDSSGNLLHCGNTIDQFNDTMFVDFNDVKCTNSTTAFTAGNEFFSQRPKVWKSSNGGLNWSETVCPVQSGFTLNKIIFPSAAIGITIGENGIVWRSVDGGNTWVFQADLGVEDLNDIYFTSPTKGFIAAYNNIYTTADAGLTWSPTTIQDVELRNISFIDQSIGYAGGRTLHKTIDGGNSWSTVPVLLPSYLQGGYDEMQFLNEDTGYAFVDNYIIKTVDGGLNWTKCLLSYDKINLYISSPTSAYVSGSNSLILTTNNLQDQFSPISYFNGPVSIGSPPILCNDGTPMFLTNHSDPALSSQWIYHGSVFSTSYNTTLIISNPTQMVDSVNLVVSDGVKYDTSAYGFMYTGVLQPTCNAYLVPQSRCPGKPITMQVLNSQTGTTYRLKIDGVAVGSSQTGNGDTLTFIKTNIYTDVTATITAQRQITNCGTYYDSSTVFVPREIPDTTLDVYVDQDTICYNSSIVISIDNTEQNVSYQLRSSNVSIGLPVLGNGGTITFSIDTIKQSRSFYFSATKLADSCSINFIKTVFVFVEIPASYFTVTDFNPEITDSVYVLCQISPIASSYEWIFDATANIQTSTIQNPVLMYSSTGSKEIQLITYSSRGCIDTVIHVIHVIPNFVIPTCNTAQVASGNGAGSKTTLSSMTHDNNDNLILSADVISAFTSRPIDTVIATGFNNDTLLKDHRSALNQNVRSIIKFNTKGIPIWENYISHYNSSSILNVKTDSSGNIYAAIVFQFDDTVTVYSSDRSFEKRVVSSGSVLLYKFDPNGMYLWNTEIDSMGSSGTPFFHFDENQNIWVVRDNREQLFNPQRHAISPCNSLPFRVTTIFEDSLHNQYYSAPETTGFHILKYDDNHNLLREVNTDNFPYGNHRIMTIHMDVDNTTGDLYIVGFYDATVPSVVHLSFAGDTFAIPQSNFGLFIAKWDSNLNEIWLKSFNCHGYDPLTVTGLAVMGSDLFMEMTCRPAVSFPYVITPSGQNYPINRGTWLYHLDLNSNTENLNEILQNSLNSRSQVENHFAHCKTKYELTNILEFMVDFNYNGTHYDRFLTDIFNNEKYELFIVTGDVSCYQTNFTAGIINRNVKVDKVVSVSPIPSAFDLCKIRIDLESSEKVQLEIFDISGRKISSRFINTVSGENEYKLSELVEKEFTGMFFVSVKTHSGQSVAKGMIF